MELRQLQYVVAVAEECHFGRAAERLHIGQPAVGQQIRRLERELGVALFDRSPRHVRLTEAGRRFLPAARDVVAAADRARFAAAGTAVLRLGLSAGLGSRLDRVLAALRSPSLVVELETAPTAVRVERVAAGRLDATFVRGPAAHARVRALPVWRDELVAALPADHPLAAGADVSLVDLAALPLRMTARRNNPPLVDLVLAACQDAGFDPIPGPPTDAVPDLLAGIGFGTPMWTVMYAAQTEVLVPRGVRFLRFRGDGLWITASLVVRRGAPTAHLDALLRACDHES
ncbi:LysR family transcriptional regulator [Pseudonocardia sp. GCM10023141]|uniref:LysR family transcriptional regulator n=1 Tax=Pseudonocardia sp. GCM10023141 TaxID=3252653 RepID=UPI0036139FCA